ncbi:unnamed protein product [Sphenostylis stenocarpa]|uniref:Uncharacterized protein n=1 Tax=Sphenostylis stenocarpa TaxID=92480 RepID=A0AA86S248_9FABA|nr:unnamed protein product [Sphenostylis stenocarpa]
MRGKHQGEAQNSFSAPSASAPHHKLGPPSHRRPAGRNRGPHQPNLKYRVVNKSESVSSSNSHSVKDVNVDATVASLNRDGEDGGLAFELNTVDNIDRVARSSKVEEGGGDDDDDDDGDDDDIQTRLDNLLRKIEEPELSEEQIRINDQLQQDEVE